MTNSGQLLNFEIESVLHIFATNQAYFIPMIIKSIYGYLLSKILTNIRVKIARFEQ